MIGGKLRLSKRHSCRHRNSSQQENSLHRPHQHQEELHHVANAPAGAQQSPPPNPLDAVPDKMPFDVPYGAPISLDRAEAAVAATVAEAKKRDWKMNVAVVDSGGNLVAFQRMDGAQMASIAISEHKARASATFRRHRLAGRSGLQGRRGDRQIAAL